MRSYHAIATDYSIITKFKEALDYEKKNYNILLKIIRDERDPRLVESSMLLKQYTSKAVEQKLYLKSVTTNGNKAP
jgi:hypothetical protein